MLDKALAMLSILLGYFSLVQLSSPIDRISIINTQIVYVSNFLDRTGLFSISGFSTHLHSLQEQLSQKVVLT